MSAGLGTRETERERGAREAGGAALGGSRGGRERPS